MLMGYMNCYLMKNSAKSVYFGFLVIMVIMCQCKLLDCDKCASLVWDVDSERGGVPVGARGVCKLCSLHSL